MGFGDKFKTLEKDLRTVLPSQRIVGMRLDGKSFHSFTKQYQRPFDTRFINSMNNVAKGLMSDHITGTIFAYVQSDEITLFFTDKWSEKTDYFFGGKIEKILSTSASFATGAFLKDDPSVQGVPVFDARMFILEDMDQVQEYMDWRRLDARKNAVSMAAYSIFSDKALRNVSTAERGKMLKGTEFETLPEDFFNGRILFREKFTDIVSYVNKRTNEEQTTVVERSHIVAHAASRKLTQKVVDSFRWLDKGV